MFGGSRGWRLESPGSLVSKFVVVALVVMVAVVGSGYFVVTAASQELSENARSQVRSASSAQAQQMDVWYEKLRNDARLASATGPVDGSAARARTYLADAGEAGRFPHSVVAVHLVDADRGRILASTDPSAVNGTTTTLEAAFADEPLVAADAEAVTTSAPFESSRADGPAIAFASPVAAAGGSDDGHDEATHEGSSSEGAGSRVLVLEVSAAEASAHLSTADAGNAHVVDASSGRVFFSTAPDRIGESGDAVVSGDRLRALAAGSGDDGHHEAAGGDHHEGSEDGHHGGSDGGASDVNATEYYTLDRGGTVMAAAATPIDGTDWLVVRETRRSEAFALRDRIGRDLLLGVAVVAAALLVAGVVVGRTARDVSRLAEDARAVRDGNYDVDLATDRDDEVGTLSEAVEEMRDAMIGRLEESEAFGEQLESTASEYGEVMRRCAEGDLTARMDAAERSEAMARVAAEFNAMMDEIERTVGELARFAGDVAAASRAVETDAQSVSEASARVSESVAEIAAGAERQDDRFAAASREMDSLRERTAAIAERSDDVAAIAGRTAEAGRTGREAAADAIEGVAAIERGTDAADEQMADLEAEMRQVDRLVEQIDQVAERTNMLALNAQIEARRIDSAGAGGADAGGDGDGDGVSEGFTTVANEVQELAKATKELVSDVEARADGVRSQTEAVGEALEEMRARVDENAAAVRAAAAALEEVADHAEETNRGVQEISEETEHQATSANEVVETVERAAAISERTSEEAERVAASAREQARAIASVSENAEALARRADRLDDRLDEFEFESESVAEPDSASASTSAAPADARLDGAVDPEAGTRADADGTGGSATSSSRPEPE